jgi:RNA polymerase sigma-70 factor (ECF subfamily)
MLSTVVVVVKRGSDDELLREIEGLYRGSYAAYYRVALGLLRDRERAHDAVQEAFARAVRGRSGFRGSGSLRGWVWRALTRICLDEMRAPQPRVHSEPADAETVEPDEFVRAAVAALPERQRWTIFLRYYADLSYEEIAEILEVERGTVAATLHAARKALLPAIEEVAR